MYPDTEQENLSGDKNAIKIQCALSQPFDLFFFSTLLPRWKKRRRKKSLLEIVRVQLFPSPLSLPNSPSPSLSFSLSLHKPIPKCPSFTYSLLSLGSSLLLSFSLLFLSLSPPCLFSLPIFSV